MSMKSCASFPVRAMLFCCLSGLCVHAAQEAVEQRTLSVKLNRQEIPLFNDGGTVIYRSAYFGQIGVGAPNAQNFKVVFDTGSGHLVLPSSLCRQQTCMKHRRYRRRESSTAKDIDGDGTPVAPRQPRDQISVSFGTGEITGVFIEDEMCLAEESDSHVQASSMLQVGQHRMAKQVLPTAELVEELPERRNHNCFKLRLVAAIHMTEEPFADFEFDGIFGLGLSGLSQMPEFNFLHVLGQAGSLGSSDGSQMFSVFLGYSKWEGSEITFGGWKSEHLEDGENVMWCNVVEPQLGYWQIEIFGLIANGKTIDFCAEGCRAIVDTGSSLIAVPSKVRSQLWRALLHNASADGRCQGTEPLLQLDLGNVTMTLGPEDYSKLDTTMALQSNKIDADSNTSSIDERRPDSNQEEPLSCMPMLMSMDLPEPLAPKTFILGEPVLQKYYAAFDSGRHRIGFGKARHNTQLEMIHDQKSELDEQIV